MAVTIFAFELAAAPLFTATHQARRVSELFAVAVQPTHHALSR